MRFNNVFLSTLQEDLFAAGEIRQFPNGPQESVVIMFSDDYRSYVLELAANLSLQSSVVGEFSFPFCSV